MLRQLEKLSLETDGRYASAQELEFLKNYLATVEQRISAYEKIRDAEEKILDEVERQLRARNPYIFRKGNQDYSAVCRRDRRHVLRLGATAMLFGDLNALREGFLLWYRTIIKAFRDEKAAQVTYQVLPQVVNQALSSEEAPLMQPVMSLTQSILGE
ncbi:allophycocyanin alpha subunit [Thermosynechococcus sp. NK55a]|uniref:allophycocyanin subunit alpha n=1 Tax=unclassified Thermosynechococcus TaxID=2622553 RepID=UPI0003D8FB85|nr:MULTISPECIES: allophycocyanin subunit alpha [unclassified Thermosynechococcus]AHB89408.1 allophycocyanin alpha subunit [Thermosynechococcus sp. NK55a]HIK22496.1 allophycocyanin [Thermosynechococcus sp. M3746_W2019_013]